jgi:hypothetical protein
VGQVRKERPVELKCVVVGVWESTTAVSTAENGRRHPCPKKDRHQPNIVGVATTLFLKVEGHLFPATVGVKRREHPGKRVVEQCRAGKDGGAKSEVMDCSKEGWVVADRHSLVVLDRPTALDP